MGLIKKKTAVRGSEGGLKYICDVCSADITSTVRIRCAHSSCHEYDLCVPCFSQGSKSKDHDPGSHPYYVIEQHSIPIFDEEWGADEETLLLEGAETYGLGSWADIADHIGGYRDKDEVRDHYINTYVNSPNFPLPMHASPADTALTEEWPREKFLPRKKRRIEQRKEERSNASPPEPTKRTVASTPACHEVAGYMPGRMEFEIEHFNDAEEVVQHMQFDPGEGEGEEYDSNGRVIDEEVNLKMMIMQVYNARLTSRVERKRIYFEHELLEYKRKQKEEKALSAEEKAILHKAKPFARLMRRDDFKDFLDDLLYEHNLRHAISTLQEWRRMQVSEFKAGEKYEQEKQARIQRLSSYAYDRHATSQRAPKIAAPIDTPPAIAALTGPELPDRSKIGGKTPSLSTPFRTAVGATEKKILTNGDLNAANGMATPIPQRPSKFEAKTANNVAPLKWEVIQPPDLHILTKDEQDVCSILRICPKPYIVMKENVMREAQKHGGILKKKNCREICHIDSQKAAKLFDFWSHSGWIAQGR